MIPIYSAENIRAWDQFTIEKEPISSLDLMERAATNCYRKISDDFDSENFHIFCGIGNNGGDGLVIARLLAEKGKLVTVYVLEFSSNRTQDFQSNLERLPEAVDILFLQEGYSSFEINSGIVIDAIFGSGLTRPVTGWLASVINSINQSQLTILSIDIPSGLFIENNSFNGEIIKATKTYSFQIPKLCFFFQSCYPYVGDWQIVNIGLRADYSAKTLAKLIEEEDFHLRELNKYDHKGNNGWLTVIAGFENMGGAAILASGAALKSGCGYCGVICNKEHFDVLLELHPELLLNSSEELSLPSKSRAIAIGPGLGTSAQAQEFLKLSLASGQPIILDADALNILAQDRDLLNQLPKDAILTPHQAELGRLIGSFENEEERLEEQRKFSMKHGIYIIQKGPYSKLTCPDGEIIINSSGNEGMATAGMGDVLTGMIGSFLAQGMDARNAAMAGMFFHGKAGDIAASVIGKRSMTSSDVVLAIPSAIPQD